MLSSRLHGNILFLFLLFGRGCPIRSVGTLLSSPNAIHGSVLYIVRTSAKTQLARLPAILTTWAAPVQHGSLLVVGSESSESPKVYGATGCGDDHGQGLNCKTGHALALAASMIGTHDWAFLVDDDVYVNTSNVESTLKAEGHDPAKLQALGIIGCRPGSCQVDGDGLQVWKRGGFCGGGGYAMSRATLKALVDKPEPKDFRQEFVKKMHEVFQRKREEPADDITATCMMRERGVSLLDMKGLYGWHLGDAAKDPTHGSLNADYLHAIHGESPLPLTFHYISPTEMHLIHDEFTRTQPDQTSWFPSIFMERRPPVSYDEQLRQYLLARNA